MARTLGAIAVALTVVACTEGAGTAVLPAALASDDHRGRRDDERRRGDDHAERLLREGKEIFRFDTFGGEDFWGGTLRLHEAIAGSAGGGIGPGVSPRTALAVGLEVDSEALRRSTFRALVEGRIDLDDPASTLALLREGAVVGVKGFFEGERLSSIGITCALCHSTVDDSVAPGIGRRLDGWPNLDLNVGAIVNLSPDLSAVTSLLGVDDATARAVLASWGPGRFDASLFMDGKAFRPDGATAAVVLPPAYGLAGVNLHTYEGWGSVTHWNAFVANLEMHGKGTFFDPRLDDAERFPVAARAATTTTAGSRRSTTSSCTTTATSASASPPRSGGTSSSS
jgi:hypothetical protein